MKKLRKRLAKIGAGAALLLATAVNSQAVGGCDHHWFAYLAFFYAGGSVVVNDGNGFAQYTVTKDNVVANQDYPLDVGWTVNVTPPDCNNWIWGSDVFCHCLVGGGEQCGNSSYMTINQMHWEIFMVTGVCNCPNGTSWGSVTPYSAFPCGGGGQ